MACLCATFMNVDMVAAQSSREGTSVDEPRFGELGEAGISAGAMKAQGDFTQFADTGWHIEGHFSLRVPALRATALWIDANYTQFNTKELPGELRLDTGEVIPGVQRVKHWSSSIHAGPQIGSPTRRGVLRPRLGAGLGWYLFVIDNEIEVNDIDEPIETSSTYLGRFGWRGNVGLDIFPSRKYGISLQFLYDQIWNMNLQTPEGEVVDHVEYMGGTIGVVFPLQNIFESSEETDG